MMEDLEDKLLSDLRFKEIKYEEFLDKYPIKITDDHLIKKLENIINEKDSEKLRALFSVFYNRGFFPKLCKFLEQLLTEDWHNKHEDIARSLQFHIRCPNSVDSLIKSMELKFEYLFRSGDYEPFVTKCMYAIADLGTDYSIQKLTELSLSEDPIFAEAAKFQLDRLAEEARQAESTGESARDYNDPGLEGLSPEKHQMIEECLHMEKGSLTPELCRKFDEKYLRSKNKVDSGEK